MIKKIILTALFVGTTITGIAQNKIAAKDIAEKMKWFEDAKLGIFIHAGIYSVADVSESWSFHNGKISVEDYMKQQKSYTLSNYDPAAWADMIKDSGAKYTVITTKHHDGVAMYDTKLGKLSSVKTCAAKKDMVKPFFEELRKRDIKCGAYFSLIDWTHNDYPGFLKDKSRYDIKKEPARWERFQKFYQGQIKEISDWYNPDLWWFDGDWEHSAEEWQAEKTRKMMLDKNPNTIINGRLQGYGDYDTPEQNFPVVRPAFKWWELCMTMNENWGYRVSDTNWKTPYEIITIFVDAVSNGGNLLLDIGPKPDGTYPETVVSTLKELGDWNRRNGEGIFGTIPGIPLGHFYGPTTLSKDSKTLYLFVHGKTSGQLMLKGLDNKIQDITVLGSNIKLTHKVVGKISWSAVPGLVYIDLPENVADKYVTCIKVTLDAPIKLYRGQGGFLTN
ncbi:alpha-L-fucosidase [Flavobacterium sp. 90]|uniref:alpha-L-fucosidase n=1 Tax=unclassified Flavobacterium TaxID=196869 RepID=UPI000EB3B911|nr:MULTISPECIES: alpha-L-fucosidase [unclassified Flavobacterium]RKR12066.1 alpha-L-fucosidase [Flavobacterium sp. 81]TCK55838.1 alpha-L-fucosidase [Flavobacterium sp. 90]